MDILDGLTFRSYRHQRETFPLIQAERWAALFAAAAEMERRYQDEGAVLGAVTADTERNRERVTLGSLEEEENGTARS